MIEQKVVVMGLGYIGLPTAALIASKGFTVRGVDIDQTIVDVVNAGKIHIVEPDLDQLVTEADLLVGGVLIPGAEAPKLVTKEMIKSMKRGSVIVDVAIDQGGCVETSKPTTHANPTYLVDDVVHYCVANMPGGVPRTSTMALNKATLPLLLKLADQGYKKTLIEDKNYLAGLNVYRGNITFKGVSDAFNLKYTPASDLLKN